MIRCVQRLLKQKWYDTRSYCTPCDVCVSAGIMFKKIPKGLITPRTCLQHVDLSIFDLTGRKITTLVNQMKQEGTYEVSWAPESISNGIYIASLSSNGRIIQTMKVVVSK